MTNFFYSSLLVTSLACQSSASVLLIEDFEDNAVNFTSSTPLFHDGSSDYFTITPLNGIANSANPYTGFAGGGYFAVEDMDDGGTRPSSAILSFTVNITGFQNFSLDLLFAAGNNLGPTFSTDSNDGVLITGSIDGGAAQNLLAFEATGTTNMQTLQDTDFDGTGDGFAPTSAFTAFNGLAITGTGTTLTVEVQISSNDGGSEYAFDNIVINGDAVPEPSSTLLLGCGSLALLARRKRS